MNRVEFVILFDVKNGNPNGDPDGDNAPRSDPETGHGLVTDVCVKRKIRDRIALTRSGEKGMGIYVQRRAVLALVKAEAYKALGLDVVETVEEGEEGGEGDVPAPKAGKKKPAKKASGDFAKVEKTREWMQANYWDVRTFGAVMSGKGANCGQARGPVQLTFAESIDPVLPQRVTLTRCAVETQDEADRMGGQNQTMGGKWIVPYGLYRMHGFISPRLAANTGFSAVDLDALWAAILGMFDDDRSASRGMMAVRKLVIFQHASELGNASAHKLFERVSLSRLDPDKPARAFTDYALTIGEMPPGITVEVRE